ncbi:hypothetical protein BC936DRAFT_145501 [Jimgerdemannia flammicorona]|uniref:C2 domain-containing protein n=1 Tax=Jimgerdemannia flammicorona TaxID=994334 RepID=A0A433D9W4_9FUNG|nr:hypothetical protein BC936DRAFT_145501 [Jimgerdemannia flammicorona]
MRRPVTGKLQLKILAARQVAHAPTWTFKTPETMVVIKIDGNVNFKTKPSRSDKWGDDCEIHVDKASEVEISLYDQSGEKTMPIGVLWMKISDIAEGLRRKKLEMDSGPGWVPAEVAAAQAQPPQDQPGYGGFSPQQGSFYGQPPQSPYGNDQYQSGQGLYGQQQQGQYGSGPPQFQSTQSMYYGNDNSNVSRPTLPPSFEGPPPPSQEGIEAWFDIEPVGQIALSINFSKFRLGYLCRWLESGDVMN